MARIGQRLVGVREPGGPLPGGGKLAIARAVGQGLGQLASGGNQLASAIVQQQRKQQQLYDVATSSDLQTSYDEAAHNALAKVRQEAAASDPDFRQRARAEISKEFEKVDADPRFSKLSPGVQSQLSLYRKRLAQQQVFGLDAEVSAATDRTVADSVGRFTNSVAASVGNGESTLDSGLAATAAHVEALSQTDRARAERLQITTRGAQQDVLQEAFYNHLRAENFADAEKILTSKKYRELIDSNVRGTMEGNLKRQRAAATASKKASRARVNSKLYDDLLLLARSGELGHLAWNAVKDKNLTNAQALSLGDINDTYYNKLHKHSLLIANGLIGLDSGLPAATNEDKKARDAVWDDLDAKIVGAYRGGDEETINEIQDQQRTIAEKMIATGYIPASAAASVNADIASGDPRRMEHGVVLGNMLIEGTVGDPSALGFDEFAVSRMRTIGYLVNSGQNIAEALRNAEQMVPKDATERESRASEFASVVRENPDVLGGAANLVDGLRSAKFEASWPSWMLAKAGLTGLGGAALEKVFGAKFNEGTKAVDESLPPGAESMRRDLLRGFYTQYGDIRLAEKHANAVMGKMLGYVDRGERYRLEFWPPDRVAERPLGAPMDFFWNDFPRAMRQRLNADGSRTFSDEQISNMTLASVPNTPKKVDTEGRTVPQWRVVWKDKYEKALWGVVPRTLWHTGDLAQASGTLVLDGSGMPIWYGAPKFIETPEGRAFMAEQNPVANVTEAKKQREKALNAPPGQEALQSLRTGRDF